MALGHPRRVFVRGKTGSAGAAEELAGHGAGVLVVADGADTAKVDAADAFVRQQRLGVGGVVGDLRGVEQRQIRVHPGRDAALSGKAVDLRRQARQLADGLGQGDALLLAHRPAQHAREGADRARMRHLHARHIQRVAAEHAKLVRHQVRHVRLAHAELDVLHAKLIFPQQRRVGLKRRDAARLRDLPDGLSGGLRRLGGVGDQQTVEPAFSMRAYVVGAEKRRPVLNILQRRRFCAAVNKEQEEITRDTLPASSRPYRPDAIPLCRCYSSGRADRAAAPCADTRFLFRAARFAAQRVHDWKNSA